MKNTIEIYCNYGVLAAEKRHVYTYGGQHMHATCSDKMTVIVPDGWKLFENVMGTLMVEAPWGWTYEINEVLAGNEYPQFRAYDKDDKLRIFRLKEVDEEK